jgi:nucleotide-binding universal stress UspA family protein
MERIAVTAKLSPGTGDEARRLLAAGPPYDPASAGFSTHDVYIAGEFVFFVFEGPQVEAHVSALLDDPLRASSFAPWGPLLEEPPMMAHNAYHWNAKEDVMNTILIATDGSESSLEALSYGLDLAQEHDTDVCVVHVEAEPSAREPLFAPAGPLPEWPGHKEYATLTDAARIARERGMAIDTKLLVGHVVDEIVAYADSIDAGMIVVGSRGRGAITSALLGSVSRGILKEARRPVLVVRDAEARAEAAPV